MPELPEKLDLKPPDRACVRACTLVLIIFENIPDAADDIRLANPDEEDVEFEFEPELKPPDKAKRK